MKREQVCRGYKKHALALALGLCIVGSVHAQSTTGTISGSAPVGTPITVTSNSGLNRTVVADEKGRYNVSNLPVGPYTVTVGEGRRDVVVTVGGNSNVSFVGDAATTLGTVNVTAMAADSIDVRSVSSSTVVTAQEIQRMPLARSAEAIALLAPGAVAGNPVFFGNSVSLGGASVAENAYYINGFFTGNPMTNVGGYTLPYGSIEQQETYTGGYSAKYGRSDGGVLNQIGKSGSNDFHFGAQVTWTPKGLRAGTPDRHLPNESLPEGYAYQDDTLVGRLLSRGDRSESWGETYSAYVSGPLIRNRLFGFVSLEQERTETAVYPTVLGAPQSLRDTTKNPKLYAKLNWNINDNNLLELTYMAQQKRYQGDYYIYDFAEDVEGERNGSKPNEVKENNEFSIIKYTGYLTDSLTLNAMYGHSRLRYSSVPTLTGFDHVSSANLQNPAFWPVGTPTSGITNPQAASNGTPGADDYGDGLRLELEWVLGRHTLTAGIDNQKFEAKNEGVDMLIDRWIYHSTNAPDRAINATLDVGAPGSRYYVRKYIYSNSTSMSLEQKGWYLEDKWQVTDNLLLSLGVRNDQFTNKNNTGAAYVDTGDQWAPRLGFSWDVFGDASFKLFGNAGRYYLALPQAVAVRGASSSTFTSEYFTYTGIDENGVPTGLVPVLDLAGAGPAGPVSSNHETGQPKDAGSFAPTDLKSSYQDEFIVGFQARLNENWNYGAKATYRDLKAAMDDTCDSAAMATKLEKMGIDPSTVAIPGSEGLDGGCFIVNVGDSNTFRFANKDGGGSTTFRMTPQDWGWTVPMKRTYKAIDLFLEHPFNGKWEARIDYTLSKSEGNMEGPANSDSGQGSASHDNGVSTSVNWDGPAFMFHSMGYLPNDRRHQIKARGSYAFTPEWLLSANVRMQSGMPITCWGFLNDQGGDPAVNETDPVGYGGSYYHTCFGKASPPGQRYTPWTTRLDLGVRYKPAFADGKLALSLDVFNLFNQRKPTAIDGVSEDEIATVSNTYNMPLRFATPRYVTMSLAYDW